MYSIYYLFYFIIADHARIQNIFPGGVRQLFEFVFKHPPGLEPRMLTKMRLLVSYT